ncbi:MAG: anti-sigma factor family protein [Candidatus Kapaibacteriota bacterium]
MNYSEFLHDWIDGALAPEHEEAVFIALSRQPELRLELQDLMRIRTAVQNDTAAFTPSPSDTSAIFGRLGFSVPADIPSLASASLGASAASSASSGASVLASMAAMGGAVKLAAGAAWKSYGAALVSACFASLITIVFLDWRSGNLFQNGSNTSFRGGNAGEAVSPTNPVPGTVSGLNAASGNGAGFEQNPYFAQGKGLPRYGATTDTVRERIVIREVVRYVPMAMAAANSPATSNSATSNLARSEQTSDSDDNTSFAPPALQPVPPHSSMNDNPFAKAAIKPHTALSDNTLQLASSLPPSASSEESFTDVLHRFRLGVRGFTTLWLPAPSMEPSATPFFNNAALSLYYALSPNRFIGLEVGQEAFFQRYQSTENQDTYTVTQYPTQWWAGLTYRYNFTPEELFSPYASATLGVATYGFLGRTQVGCTYSPDGITQFLLGVEASALVYGHQGANYVSPKVGVTYGVSLRW